MLKIKRGRCEVLHLVLTRKWYEMIDDGLKNEEYRTSKNVCAQIEKWYGRCEITRRKRIVEFHVGYYKGRSSMAWFVDYVSLRDDCFNPSWGEPNTPHYVLSLGSRVTLVDGREVE